MKQLSLIVAMAKNRVIGQKGSLPWRLPEDMAQFKKLTLNHPVIMGRKTWESLPASARPLPQRKNIIITRNEAFQAQGATVCPSLNAALSVCREDDEIFIIGGAAVYAEALPLAQKIYLTRIDATIAGDTRFPKWDQTEWRQIAEISATQTAELPYAFEEWERESPTT